MELTNDNLGLFTQAPRDKLKDGLKIFFENYKETLRSYVGENLPNVIHLSYGIANMVSNLEYLRDPSSKKDGHKLDCVTRGIVYTAIRTLSEDNLVPKISYDKIAELKSKKNRCTGNSINEVYKIIDQETTMKDMTISDLMGLAKDV